MSQKSKMPDEPFQDIKPLTRPDPVLILAWRMLDWNGSSGVFDCGDNYRPISPLLGGLSLWIYFLQYQFNGKFSITLEILFETPQLRHSPLFKGFPDVTTLSMPKGSFITAQGSHMWAPQSSQRWGGLSLFNQEAILLCYSPESYRYWRHLPDGRSCIACRLTTAIAALCLSL